jgi:ubiquinol-cytochrome c reductase iron-sulfur subunit
VTSERWIVASFAVSTVAALTLAVVYWQGGQPQAEGILLAAALGGIGVGIVLWAKRFMPNEEVEEERGPLASREEEVAEFGEVFHQGGLAVTRRRLLVRMATAAMAALGVAVLFPIRSLGPRPGRNLKVTPYKAGLRLVTVDAKPIRADELEVDSVLTAFPEGHVDASDASTLVIRTRPTRLRPREGREDWAPEGIVAYSKLCTHVGCPVGLYQAEEALLLCPCHQSTFDVLDGARPVFGPATRSLPQLPIEIDADGFLVARGDFSDPVGPGFWDRER